MKYNITYRQMITVDVEARDIDEAARIACATVLTYPKDSVYVHKIMPVKIPQLTQDAI